MNINEYRYIFIKIYKMKDIIINIMNRVGFAGVGLFGVCSALPNIMMSASGSNSAILAGSTGLIASSLLVMSGISGVFYNRYIPLKIGKTLGCFGIIAQISAFVLPSLIFNE